MKVSLAIQVLSFSVACIACAAIKDDGIELYLNNKAMYNHLPDLYEILNTVVDLYNARDGPHTPKNGYARQVQLLDGLSWFTGWKAMHNKAVADKKDATTEYKYFAKETWFCNQALLLSHVATIQIYCIEEKMIR